MVDPRREEAELREYLGAAFEPRRLMLYEQQLRDEFEQIADERAFYRTSEAYLYDLTAFAMSQTKQPYLRELVRAAPPGARILDWGCGIGSDGLALLEAGFDVAFADFDNPSTRYLRWRLARRGLDATVYDLDRDIVPDGFDLAYAFDVVEHVDDPRALLREIESRARLVLVNFLAGDGDANPLHRELPVDELVSHAARHGLRRYRIVGGRSHLVLYEPASPSRIRASAALAAGRIRASAALAAGRIRAATRAASARARIAGR